VRKGALFGQYASNMNSERLPERTVPGLFFRQVDRLGSRTMLRHHRDGQWTDVSWRQLADLVVRTATRLIEEGVAPGDRILLISENRLEWILSDLAIMTAGAVTTPVYPSTPPAMAQQITENSQARLAIVSSEALAGHVEVPRVVRMDSDLPGWLEAAPSAEALSQVEERAAALSPDDLATIVYTSGTTGEPKGVMLAQRNLIDVTRSCLQAFDVGEDDVELSFLPYSHVLERINGLLVLMAAGATAWISRGVERLADDMAECRPTIMVAVPRVYEKMHQRVMAQVGKASPRRQALFRWALGQGRRRSRGQFSPLYPLADRLVLSTLRRRLTGGRMRFFVSGGAPLSREVEEFFWSFGVKIFNGWGMTETSSGATSNTERYHKFETVGKPLPGVEIRIAEDGEILVLSPGNMLGYFRNEAATAEVLRDGWIYSGDIGELDDEGFLRITDRKKDLIKTAGGKFVAPQPLESRLQADPIIERAVVLGDQRPYAVALIVPDWNVARRELGLSQEPASLVDDERLRGAVQRQVDALNSELGSWEKIKDFKLLAHDFSEQTGELTPTLKVKRKAVQERYREQIDEMYQGKGRPARAAR
jgi:long-chain acyl-CoA synthetase